MPKQIKWSPQANEDLDKVLTYLAQNWDSTVSLRFLALLERVLEQVAINPRQFPLINKSLNIRKCVVTKQNTLYYRNRRSVLEVVRLFDSRQNPENLEFKATST